MFMSKFVFNRVIRLLLYIICIYISQIPLLSADIREEQGRKSIRLKTSAYTIFDDKMLLNGYKEKYMELDKDTLLAMIKDYTLSPYKIAAAVMAFNKKFGSEIVYPEKRIVEKIFIRRLNRSASPFVEVAIMYSLCCLDRYRYFKVMVPALIRKLDHYNAAVNDLAFEDLCALLYTKKVRPREARIVFNTLRKMMFLSRKRLAFVKEPDSKLRKKLELLRWAVKVLGSQELKKLPKEMIHLI